MEEEKEPSPEYIKSFNHGFLLAKYEPKLAGQLAAQKNDDSEYFKGLVSGKKEYDVEIQKWRNSFGKGGSAKDDRSLDKER